MNNATPLNAFERLLVLALALRGSLAQEEHLSDILGGGCGLAAGKPHLVLGALVPFELVINSSPSPAAGNQIESVRPPMQRKDLA